MRDIKKRDDEIWKMREQGITFSQIASHFGISPSRAQQIYIKRKEEIDNFEKWPPLKKLLSKRLQNILIKSFGSEEILGQPEKLATMGLKVFLSWRNMGRKGAMELLNTLESIGYSVEGNRKPVDSRCVIYLKVGQAILRHYFNYSQKHLIDDAEYIPTVRVIIEGIIEEMRSSGMEKANCEEVAQKLKDFNRQMYQNSWIEHAKEDQDTDEEPFDMGKEYELAQYTFDYIYKHKRHPPNSGF